MELLLQLAVSTGAVTTTALVHLAGLALLIGLLVVAAVGSLFVLHAIEIWLYAAFYVAVGELKTFSEALYFSTSTYATIGYGDIVLTPRWRIVGAIEGVNGIILLGWSTAFFVSIVQRLDALERGELSP